MPGSCLSDEIIAQLVDDMLAGQARDELDAHIDSCANCRTVLVALGSEAPRAMPDAPELPWLRTGDAIGRYTIVAWLGSGGMGQVYRATDPVLKRDVALKLVRGLADARSQERLAAEAQAMAQLAHPNVVSVFDAGEGAGTAFIAMELVEGMTLREWIAASKPDRATFARAFSAAARGLIAAHKAGILHRDFKPQNVLVDAEGWVRVSDFGLASLVEPEDHDGGGGGGTTARGTPGYIAPECEQGAPPSERSDVYSYGVTLAECLASAHSSDRRLLSIAKRASADEPTHRYESMEKLLAALERRRASRLPAVGLALALASLGVAGLWWRGRQASVDPCSELQARQARLRDSSRATGPADARLDDALESFVGRLEAERASACAEVSSPLREAKLGCFSDRLDDLGAALGQPPAERETAVLELDPPARCTAEARVPEHPSDLSPELAKAFDDRFARAQAALYENGESEVAAAELERLAVELEAHRYLLLESTTQLVLAEIYAQTSDDEKTRAAARRALTTAQQSGNGGSIFDAALLLVELEIQRDPSSPAISDWLSVADASRHRLGNHPYHQLRFSQIAGYLEIHRGNHERALELLHSATELSAEIYAPRSAGVASALFNEASALLLLSRPADALEKLGLARALLAEVRGEDGTGAHQILGAMGQAQTALMDPAAVATFERALELAVNLYGGEGEAAASAHLALGVALLRFERAEEAAGQLQRGLDLRVAIGGDNSLGAALARVQLSKAQASLDRNAQGIRELELALPVLDGEPPHPWLAQALLRYGDLLCLLDRCQQALAPLRRALAIRVAEDGPESPEAAEVTLVLGSVLVRGGQRTAGTERMRAALTVFEPGDVATYASALLVFGKSAQRGDERRRTLEQAAALLDRNDRHHQSILRQIEKARERPRVRIRPR